MDVRRISSGPVEYDPKIPLLSLTIAPALRYGTPLLIVETSVSSTFNIDVILSISSSLARGCTKQPLLFANDIEPGKYEPANSNTSVSTFSVSSISFL